jgi:SAM-dependent methyltransferase
MTTTSIMRKRGNLIISDDTNYQGYQYDIDKKICTPTNHRTIPKWQTIKSIWPEIIQGNSFIDIGASMGFFCFKAIEFGAIKAIGIEDNSNYFNAVKGVSGDIIEYHKLRFPNIEDLKADVVMALSVIHHILQNNTIENVSRKLSSITNKTLIIEWIDKNDRTNEKYKYGELHKWENMQSILGDHFQNIKLIGNGHHETRKIYLCQKM